MSGPKDNKIYLPFRCQCLFSQTDCYRIVTINDGISSASPLLSPIHLYQKIIMLPRTFAIPPEEWWGCYSYIESLWCKHRGGKWGIRNSIRETERAFLTLAASSCSCLWSLTIGFWTRPKAPWAHTNLHSTPPWVPCEFLQDKPSFTLIIYCQCALKNLGTKFYL